MNSKEIYYVLARKYRPQNFADLIGQEVLVKILSNSFLNNRIAHAFVLTGIRGTGKTTTARLISKTLNCSSPKIEQFLVLPCEICVNCIAYQGGKHPDLIELDAASRTGVADMREIIESSRYLPSLGKYKFYVIDEAHMLSHNAFNALLKTLEEPPEHTKFILASTDIKKIPLTIISRCQRFDLLRISQDVLIKHIEKIAIKENYKMEREAARLLAEASGGSARDSLSLLDNTLSYLGESNANYITLEHVKEMLGVVSPNLIYELFDSVILGNTKDSLVKLGVIYSLGVDLNELFEDLLEIITLISKLHYIKNAEIPIKFANIHEYSRTWLEKANIEFLTSLWQMVAKGLQEMKSFSNSLATAEIIIIRLCNVFHLPLPSELVKKLDMTEIADIKVKTESKHATFEKKSKLSNFDQVLQLFKENHEMIIYHYLYEDVQLVSFENNRIELNANQFVPKDLAKNIQKFLDNWTDEKWSVVFSEEIGQKTLKEQKIIQDQDLVAKYEKDNKIIEEIYTQFPGAQIINIIKE